MILLDANVSDRIGTLCKSGRREFKIERAYSWRGVALNKNIVAFFILSLLAVISGCVAPQEGKDVAFSGLLEVKPWDKSAGSYCAQGSQWVSIRENEVMPDFGYIVECGEDVCPEELTKYDGKLVSVKGTLVEKRIPAPGYGMQGTSNQPDGSYVCEVLKIREIKLA